jgi:hypothetical protein
MANIRDLPHEIVAAIGDHLLPKYRCRFFICCKLWQRECAWPHCALFKWHSNIHKTLKIVQNINYTVATAKTHVVSRRQIPNKGPTHTLYRRTGRPKNIWCLDITNAEYLIGECNNILSEPQKFVHLPIDCTDDSINRMEIISIYHETCMENYKPELYKFYKVMMILGYYLSDKDCINVEIAYKLYYIPLFNKKYARYGRWSNNH